MRIRTFASAALITLATLCARSTASEVLVNGGFENEPNFGSGVSGDAGFSALTGSQIPGWTVEAGHAATVHNTVLYKFISGSFSVNVDGEGFNGVNANIFQSFPTVSGDHYDLAFDWAGWILGTSVPIQVTVIDTVTSTALYDQSFVASETAITHHQTANLIGTGNVWELRVRENPESGINDNTYIVDNFSVNHTEAGGPPVVPLPAALPAGLGLLSAMGAFGFLRRERARE